MKKAEKAESWFTHFAKWTAREAGRPGTFAVAVALLLTWAVTGPVFGFSDTWQLIVNTGTTIVTFFMVFLIQNTQNRDAAAVQAKLDELIRVMKGARGELMDLEEREEDEVEQVKNELQKLAGGEDRSRPATVSRMETDCGRSNKTGL